VLTVVSLFSGIGGFELGFSESGMDPILFCEIDPAAQAVLRSAWPQVPLVDDIETLRAIPRCDVITAGFPCQDLSQAGQKAGISGGRSGLVDHLFRLLKGATQAPKWVVVENVPYMLGLDRGHAMEKLIVQFEALGYFWTYRVVDTRAFGIPQRRQRVLFVASKEGPLDGLLAGSAERIIDEKPSIIYPDSTYGFYWTEGSRGLGWVRDGVPPIKGGSGLGIPSPPAIWIPKTGELGKPSLTDAERLQGFPVDWTLPAIEGQRARAGTRWRLIGNAVNVLTARWLASRLRDWVPTGPEQPAPGAFNCSSRWPAAATGHAGNRVRVERDPFPQSVQMVPIVEFLQEPLVELSQRAAQGFLNRALNTPKLVYSNQFLDSVSRYCGKEFNLSQKAA